VSWAFQKLKAVARNRVALGNGAPDDSVRSDASVEDRAAIGAARVAAHAVHARASLSSVGDLFPDERGVPEVHARNLSASGVASALHHHGSLVVRELFDVKALTQVRAHLHPDPLRILGLPVPADVDAMVAELARVYESSGLLRVVRDYLSEPPVAAAHRIVVRRSTRETGGLAWHQDGQFFGTVGGLNVWTALDDCGVDRPSLNFVPRRVDYLIAPERTELSADPGIDAAVSELLADRPFAEPPMRAGDAVLFDEMTVHRTGTRSWAVPHRDVAITWFFAPSRFPPGPTPLAF